QAEDRGGERQFLGAARHETAGAGRIGRHDTHVAGPAAARRLPRADHRARRGPRPIRPATPGLAASPQGINILPATLVFATAVIIDPAALRRLPATWPSLLAVLVAGITVLPALAWVAAQIAAAGPRDGIMTSAWRDFAIAAGLAAAAF